MPLIDDYLFNPNQRLYWAYLLSAAVVAVLYWLWQPSSTAAEDKQDAAVAGQQQRTGRLSKLAAKLWRQQGQHPQYQHPIAAYWLHRSALLDYRYFVVVWLLKLYLLAPLILSAKTVAVGVFSVLSQLHSPAWLHCSASSVMLIYTLLLFVVGEFSRYWLHRWLHTVKWLWQFHKIHHSAEVLNPLTFYRVHPLENLLFGLRYALSAGVVTGLCLWLFGAKLGLYQIGGANAAVALFALVGGNLRHSHIYLRYPRWVEVWLMSPAQHQLHHTGRYAQFNYGGYLSIFDRWFGTLQPSQRITQPSQFGFPQPMASQYRSVIALLWQPLRDCCVLWRTNYEHHARQNQPDFTGRQPAWFGGVEDDAHGGDAAQKWPRSSGGLDNGQSANQ